ncbi:DUF5020 family protein [Porphyromonadaceae bacterium W3.11]|nr:DUF5020 family protein [Porphyromonadaceae bacterium W3.11]
MKRKLTITILALVLTCLVSKVMGQTSVEYHYNFGKHLYEDRKNDPGSLITVQHFSADPWGNNLFFVDFLMGGNNMSEAYFEIFRNLKFWEEPIALHFEYNGGLNQSFIMNHAYLVGVNWSYVNLEKQFNLGVTMSYRHDQKHERPHNMQLTTNWCWTSWNKVWTLSGFLDLWTQRIEGIKSGVVLLSEPQIWMNLNQFQGVHDDFNLSIGSEIKVSYNFLSPDKFLVRPTLALKWTFK